MTLLEGKKIAVIGGGVAGITAAWLLGKRHSVTLFEKNAYVGGHTHTVTIENGEDAGLAVDTGFIVCNDRTYENFHRLLGQLGCGVRNADMSFGYEDQASGLQYAGTNLNGLFAQRGNAFNPGFYGLLANIVKFMRLGRQALEPGRRLEGSLGDFLAGAGISEAAIRHYVLPMGAAIWSAPREKIMAFPAASFLGFFKNHGLLSVTGMPQWQTVLGGSHSYVKAFQGLFPGEIFSAQPVRSIRRGGAGASLRMQDGTSRDFDAVVVAAHADEALKLLEDPSPDEARLLGAWRYQLNRTVLHTDEGLLPSNRRAWASWNYVREKGSNDSADVTVTYHMNRLQGLRAKNEYCVTLNLSAKMRPERIIKTMDYMHPVFDASAVASQAALPSLNGQRHTWFCGSYFGHGFHEDAVKAGAAVGRDFGVEL
jgi:predicted NAD/FAD-binding protein